MSHRIKELRKEQNMTLLEVANRIGVSEGTVQRYESGNIRNLKYDTVVNLSKLFGVTPGYLMGWEENKSVAPVYDTAAGKGRINDGYPTETYDIGLKPEEFLHRVYGNSMYPTIEDQDMVIVKAQTCIDYDGQIALVRINGEENTVKRVEKKDNGLLIIGDNVREYPPRLFTEKEVRKTPVRIIGIVTRIIREVR